MEMTKYVINVPVGFEESLMIKTWLTDNHILYKGYFDDISDVSLTYDIHIFLIFEREDEFVRFKLTWKQ